MPTWLNSPGLGWVAAAGLLKRLFPDSDGENPDCVFDGPKRPGFCSCGFGRLNTELEIEPAPVLLLGGGPAGVVDVPNNPALGLLTGVKVSAWLEPAGFPNDPNIVDDGAWPVFMVSEGLFGVLKAEKPVEAKFVEDVLLLNG